MPTDDRSIPQKLRGAAEGIATTARGKLMIVAAEALEHADGLLESSNSLLADTVREHELEVDRLRGRMIPEQWVAIDSTIGPAVFYLAIDGMLYQLDDTHPGTIEPTRERMVARALVEYALTTLQEANRG